MRLQDRDQQGGFVVRFLSTRRKTRLKYNPKYETETAEKTETPSAPADCPPTSPQQAASKPFARQVAKLDVAALIMSTMFLGSAEAVGWAEVVTGASASQKR